MWQTPGICIVCILFGLVCDVSQVCVKAEIIHRKGPADATKLKEDIHRLIEDIHGLSKEYENTEDASPTSAINPDSEPSMETTPRMVAFSMFEGVDFDVYYGILKGLIAVYNERFIDNLPKTLVCILSGREDCGLEAELTKTVSLELVKPLLTLASSLRPQTCTRPTAGSEDEEIQSYLRSFLNMEESTISELNIFQEMFVTTLSQLPLSGILRSIVDKTVTYFSTSMMTLLQTLMDYVKIALQIGIEVPSLDQSEHCQQGDLKQLLMWGMNHNVSWSFGNSILDIFLAPEPSLCSFPEPECQSPHSGPFSRSGEGLQDDDDDNRDILLKCDRHNLASLNHTLCADITMSSFSPSLFTFCQALSSLTTKQLEQVWSNTCHVIQALASPVVSSDCGVWGTQPPPAALPSSETLPHPRMARALSLNQLLCNYGDWSGGGVVDAGLVTLCGDNDREEFVKRVCNDAVMMRKLLSDQKNNWLWVYCANSSADTAYMVRQFCLYERWMSHPTEPVDPLQVAFCWNLDRDRLKRLICENVILFTILFSDPENFWLMPNCTEVPPPPAFNLNSLVAESCNYSQWQDLTRISMNIVSLCIQHDPRGFITEVCSNTTFLIELLQHSPITWLEEYCNMSLNSPPTDPPQFIPDWCDYQLWAERPVDPSIVGLCWQHDQLAFQKNVCCNMPLFENLTREPQNEWLMSVCSKETTESMPQVCRYSEWAQPVIIDMTDLALCAELDPLNFTCNVCSNSTVLQNLLANLDNIWLLQHCANHSSPVATALCGGGTGGDGLMGFKPTEQCHYSNWDIRHPDAALLALCWDYDQGNFVSTVCPDAGLLSSVASEPSSAWVSTLCAPYTNHSTTSNGNSSTTEPQPCLARDLVRRFNWSCSADFSSVCRPGASQTQALQVMMRCWMETLRPRVEGLLTKHIASLVDQAISITVVIMVALEESQMTTLHVTKNIRLSVLEDIVIYLDEVNFDKKRVLLQCFGKLLTSLMQTGRDATSDAFFLIKEYFRIPLGSLKAVLRAVDITMVRKLLQYYSRNKDTLQLTAEYSSTMVSVLFQTHLARDKSLFPELEPLLARASPDDIQALPPIQTSPNVRETVNRNLPLMTLEQRRAFGLWYSKALGPVNMTEGSASLIRDTGNLIVYIPFHSFQHLQPVQLREGLDVLERNTMSSLQQQFVAERLIGTYRDLTAQDFTRLGNLSCLAEPEDLQEYRYSEAFSVIQDSIRTCLRQGLSLPSYMISSWFLNSELPPPSSIPASQVAQLAHLLPLLGVDFLQDLSPSQLSLALPALASVPFTPIQARIIVEKLFPSNTLSFPGRLQTLGSLIRGVKVETLWSLTSDILLASLPTMAQHTPGLCPPQANAITAKLWGSPEVVDWLDKVEPLLSSTPLLSVLPRMGVLQTHSHLTYTQAWNTQQAKAIFKEVIHNTPNLSKEEFLNLGTVGQGVSCKILSQLFQAQPSSSSVRSILVFLREQPGPLHTSLKKCVIEELYQFEFFSELLGELGAPIALALPVSTIKKFPADMMETLRGMIIKDPYEFLLLPRTKQELLVDKMVQRMGMYTGDYTEEEFRSLGIMATFVVDEVFMQLDRRFFVDNLDFLRGLCYSAGKRDMVARILQETGTFGPVQHWTSIILNQVDMFLFFLPTDKLKELSPDLMTQARIERLFLSQRQWERGDVGLHCTRGRDLEERRALFDKQQFVLQYFLGFLTSGRLPSPVPIPSCEMLHTTLPSAWTTNSLTGMSSAAFSSCLELMGQDLFFGQYQRTSLLQKAKEVYGPVSSFTPSVISQLGGLALQLSEAELGSLGLTEISSISVMGAVSTWTNRQLAVLFSTVLNSTKRIPSELDSSTLVAMGHIICGAKTTEMRTFNAVEFSKAVLWLGRLRLACSEEQLLALVGLLAHSLAFGPASSWGTDVFIEIGALAAGLPDMAMSALVKEQIEGLTPLAISIIPPEKFAVVFDQSQISMFSYEQAVSVTAAQRSALSPVQQKALAMVLTPWEDRPVDMRGRSSGLALNPSPLCRLLGLLVLLILLPCPGR